MSIATCIDLNERFGKKYRLERDPAYHAEHGAHGRAEDPWLWIVVGRYADIFPWGGNLLGVSTHGRGARASQLKALPYVSIVQDAEDGYTLRFDVEHFAEVAKLAGLRRKRRLTEALLAAGRRTRFKVGATAVSAQNTSANATEGPGTTKVPCRRRKTDSEGHKSQPEVNVAPRARKAGASSSADLASVAI